MKEIRDERIKHKDGNRKGRRATERNEGEGTRQEGRLGGKQAMRSNDRSGRRRTRRWQEVKENPRGQGRF